MRRRRPRSFAIVAAILAAPGVVRAQTWPSDDLVTSTLPNGDAASSTRRQHTGAPATLCLLGHVAPTILMVGAQKCGSSSLWSDVMKHVKGTVSARAKVGVEPRHFSKEQHFFSKDARYRKGMAFYVSHYPTCQPGARALRAVDATPNYLRIPGTAARVHAAYAGHVRALRMIVIVRNPTDRLISWYGHIGTKRGISNLSIDEFAYANLREMRACAKKHWLPVESEAMWASACRNLRPPLYDALSGGMYAPQIAEWLHWFPARQIALVTFGGYLKRVKDVLTDLAAFIGQEPRSGASATHARALADASEVGVVRRRRAIEPSHRNVRSRGRAALSASTHAALTEFYRPHVDALIALLHRPAAQSMFSTPFRPARALTAPRLLDGSM
ncbi:hypothetical protein KFE25_005030 [Diacronema lutheri]|uniref:Sulfotransferase domain-containing protein n=1 Tax=Diacronema lutheri TaxID=2081491 RepID=A0A8J5XN51_DIALT|nr:hypothetical protein KFE25_005030 [Diacronema lutheri]